MILAKNKKIFLGLIILLFFLLFFYFFVFLNKTSAATSEEIKNKLEELKKNIEELEKQQELYEKNIKTKRKEAITLKNEISILNSRIRKTKVEITKKETEIRKVNLEIEQIQGQIQDKNVQIDDLKDKISRLLRRIYQDDNKDYLKVILLNNQISDYFNLLKANLDVQAALQQTLDRVKDVKANLENQESQLKEKKAELEQLKKELAARKTELEQNKKAKNYLLEETRGAEWKFQTLLAQAKAEMQQVEREVVKLEKKLREKLVEEEEWRKIQAGILVFSWPVPNEGITATFHDPDYPFRAWLGEHSGIDLRARQGTPIKASAAGYVGRAKDGGMGYSYILVIHQDGFSTLYGHVSKIFVSEGQYVKRGEIIGKTGGLPGTPGAGRFSTGPHLHFEIRRDGIPVNPLNYLP